MYTAISGTYEDGNLTLTETPLITGKSKVVVLFLEGEEKAPPVGSGKGVKLGSLAGQYSVPDNFNDLLDDLKEYM